jgi:hypothetical protein
MKMESYAGVKIIKVDGYPEWKYIFYSWKEAERLYRERFKLKNVKLNKVKL